MHLLILPARSVLFLGESVIAMVGVVKTVLLRKIVTQFILTEIGYHQLLHV